MSRLRMDFKVIPDHIKDTSTFCASLMKLQNFLFTVPIFSSQIRGNRRGINRKHDNKILYTRIYYNWIKTVHFLSSLMTYLFINLILKSKL